jgi:Zn-dependent alcohol dehydrogenase
MHLNWLGLCLHARRASTSTWLADQECRKGLYPVKDFPAVLGTEAAGVIALAHPEYKKRGFAVGGKVAVVRPFPPRRLRPG